MKKEKYKLMFLAVILALSSPVLGKNVLLFYKAFSSEEESKSEEVLKPQKNEEDCESCANDFDAGYTWAEYNQPKHEDECAQDSYHFYNGCYDWLYDNR